MLVLANEGIFYTLQGEGKYIGYPSVFIRLSRCNLRCAWKNPDGTITRCDTPYTSFEPEIVETQINEVVKDVANYNCEHVVVSGGEPYFQKNQFVKLVKALVADGRFVTVETNGTIFHASDAQFLSISPKLSTSCADKIYGDKQEKHRLNIDVLEQMITNHNYQFKFVVNTGHDIQEILEIKKTLFERTGIDINEHIWLMPQGTEVEQLDANLVNIAEYCKMYGWKLTDRFHIRMWGSIPGV